ncbi:MAG: NADH-quinone oxidoreductase subunit NuoH [Actinobacteria bacterium]|nr:NADH-quinone oxidoreductase subunit NuoH [Actinomycetota bacterium]
MEFFRNFTPGFLIAIGVIAASAVVFPFLMRRLWGFICDRLGPNRVGPQGLFQPFADGLKLFIKEDITPAQAHKLLFLFAPAVALGTPLLTQVVIPFSEDYTIADLNIGLIYVVAVGAFSVLGILIAGWASNNKYSLVGGLRAAAQMISYEIPLILTIILVGLLADSLSLNKVVEAQDSVWFGAIQPLAFIIYVIAGVAELNRTPFDLPEAESELVSGYNTEYGGFRFACFAALIEWGNVTVWAMAGSTLFLGGWRGPFFNSPVWLAAKVGIMALVIIWFFVTFPRLQIDQLMSFAWKMLIPLSLLNLAATSMFIIIWPDNFLLPTAILSWSCVALFIIFFPGYIRKVLLNKRLKLLASRKMTTMISGTGKGGIRS